MNDEEVTLEVTDVLGQVLYKNKVTAQSGRINETITLNNTLANGMYILNIQSGTDNKTFHFVIEQ
jgi:5-hydroxyisourate hydrolase-like protein (transthyretin family)